MVPKPLTINANTAPFKSSRLAIPPSPFSPRLPITPPATPPKAQHMRPSNKRTLSSPTTPPPSAPLNWLWQCHVCYRAYPLGATRRCLDDGHYFCSGTTAVSKRKGKASNRRAKRHRACASEFDYSSWKAWGEWRRSEDALITLHRRGGDANADDEDDGDAMSVDSGYVSSSGDRASLPSQTKAQKKDCWNTCDYPSECRWGSQYGVQSSSSASRSVAATCTSASDCASSSSSSLSQNPHTSTQCSPLSLSLQTQPTSNSSPPSTSSNTYTPPTTFDGILEGTPLASALATASASLSPTSPKDVRERFWDTLLDAARQRKHSSSSSSNDGGGSGKKSPGSPLAKAVITLPAVAEEEEEEEGQQEEGAGPAEEVPLFFDAVEHLDQETARRPEQRWLDLHVALPPPALPEPALSWQGASALDRSSACSSRTANCTTVAASNGTGRAFDFGFADKVQGALAGSTVVVAVLSDVRSAGGRAAEECVRSGRMAGMGRAKRRLIRRRPVGL